MSEPKTLGPGIRDAENNLARVIVYPERTTFLVEMELTSENFHVLEYALNSMVGLDPRSRMGFKLDVKRDVELRELDQ